MRRACPSSMFDAAVAIVLLSVISLTYVPPLCSSSLIFAPLCFASAAMGPRASLVPDHDIHLHFSLATFIHFAIVLRGSRFSLSY
jgi:hypothetical protein